MVLVCIKDSYLELILASKTYNDLGQITTRIDDSIYTSDSGSFSFVPPNYNKQDTLVNFKKPFNTVPTVLCSSNLWWVSTSVVDVTVSGAIIRVTCNTGDNSRTGTYSWNASAKV